MTGKINIKQLFNGIRIDAEINAGINLLSGDSGTGKTLLMQAIELYCSEKNIKYTFLNYRQRKNSEEQIEYLCNDSDVVIIDNADLFLGQSLLDRLQKINKYIIISLKDSSKIDCRNITEYLVHYDRLNLKLEEI